jgi:broad specificity phosphatase PhoE
VQAAKALAGRDITVVRSSPLERARQTAQPLADVFGLEPGVDERLIESENVFEGTTGGWRDPGNWRYLTNPFRPSWGEPYRQVAERMLAAAADARDADTRPPWSAISYRSGSRGWPPPASASGTGLTAGCARSPR